MVHEHIHVLLEKCHRFSLLVLLYSREERRKARGQKIKDFKNTRMAPTTEGYDCLECGAKLNHQSIYNHIVAKHIDANAIFCCPVCSRKISNRMNFKKHVVVGHQWPAECVDPELYRENV